MEEKQSEGLPWLALILFWISFIGLFYNIWFGLAGLCVTAFLIYVQINNVKATKKRNELTKENNKMVIIDKLSNGNLTYDEILFTRFNQSSISFNESQEYLYFTDLNEIKQYSFSDILESRIEENGESITRTSRSSQLGGAVIGGILAGGVGAVVGGLSGERKSETKVKSLDLVIVVDDTKQPIHKVNLLNSPGVSPTQKIYVDAKEKAEHWHGLISVFIRRATNTKIETQ